MADGPASGHHLSCAMTSALVRLVRRERGEDALDDLLARAGSQRTLAFLEDRENWVSLDEAMALLDAGARLTEDPTFPRRVGEEAVRQHAGSQVSTLLRSLGSPEALLSAITTASGKFSTVTEMEPLQAEPGHALVRAAARDGFRRDKLHCDWAAGLLSQTTVLFGLPPARVSERECQANGGSQCLYDISWDAELAEQAKDPEARVRAVEAQLSGMAARLESVYATAIDLVSPDDLDTVLDRIVQRAAGEVRATGYALAVRPRPDSELQVYSHGVDEERARALVSGATGEDAASSLRVDVASSRRSYGELVAVYPHGVEFFAQERRLLQLYAKHAAAVLDMATALHEAAQRHEQVSALLTLSDSLVHAGTSVEIAERLAEAVPSVVDCDRVGVWIWDPGGGQMHHAAGAHDELLGDLAITPGDTPALERMLEEPGPAFIAADTDDAFLSGLMARLGLAAMIVVPIVSRDEFLGVLTVSVVDRPERLEAGPELLERLTGTAGLAATALRNGRLVDALDHRARHDALTGLLDRAGFGESINAVLDDCARTGTHAGLLFVDLDGFKRINDEHGHDAGDELLRQAADRLIALVRRSDDVARLGGDEFAVILDDVRDESQVLGAAVRVRAAFAAPFELGPTSVAVSASVGHALWPDEGRTIDALLREADAAMYRDKLRA